MKKLNKTKHQVISRAAFDRAVMVACEQVGPNPPRWFREHQAIKIEAALRELNIIVRASTVLK